MPAKVHSEVTCRRHDELFSRQLTMQLHAGNAEEKRTGHWGKSFLLSNESNHTSLFPCVMISAARGRKGASSFLPVIQLTGLSQHMAGTSSTQKFVAA